MGGSTQKRIDELAKEIRDKTNELSELRRKRTPEPVEDYELMRPDGSPVRLSHLFGDKPDLIVVHNMGKDCVYCTMWADGFTGFASHLQSRAAFVVSSPDDPRAQREFAKSRGWRFDMVSTAGSTFTRDMGYQGDDGYLPGVSAFRLLDDGAIVRSNRAMFGPYDQFNATWHLFDLLAEGADDWEPQYSYG